MNQEKSKTSAKRSATEYRLSITSNPGSRRSSLGGANEGLSASNSNRTGGVNSIGDDDENFVKEYILPQIREFSDSMITLDANFTQLNFIHESLVDLNESLGALLYGLMCNSWCVDFPHISHDLGDELKFASKLDSLSNEKKSLLQQLEKLKNEKQRQSNSRSTEFVTPTFPSTQLRKPSQRAQGKLIQQQRPPNLTEDQKQNREQRHNIQNDYGDDEENDEDDNNSEASFISNPAMDLSLKRQKHDQKDASNKLRRKSILHTIRNSIASTVDLNPSIEQTNDLRRRSRLSLAGGATRIVPNRSATERPTSLIMNGRPTRIIEPSATARTSTVTSKPRSVTHRPPFR